MARARGPDGGKITGEVARANSVAVEEFVVGDPEVRTVLV